MQSLFCLLKNYRLAKYFIDTCIIHIHTHGEHMTTERDKVFCNNAVCLRVWKMICRNNNVIDNIKLKNKI